MVFLITWDYSFMLIQILPIVKKYFAYQLSNVTIVKATVIICFVKCCTQQTCSALTSLIDKHPGTINVIKISEYGTMKGLHGFKKWDKHAQRESWL